ncbi:MAG: DnaJ domain-containing protein [Agarilytica sp.]
MRGASRVLREHLTTSESKIYDLVDLLVKAQVYPWSNSAMLGLYQKLFLAQAALCELYFEYELEGNAHLVLTPISAYLESPQQMQQGESYSRHLSDTERLSPNVQFFGDPANFLSVTEVQVDALLAKFWQRFNDMEAIEPAFECLGLAPNTDWDGIQAKYRVLAAKNHPDKGGDSARFIEIRQAYEKLRRARP